MPVFLSHKREDKTKAMEIHEYLKQNRVPSYIDVLDPELQSTNDITTKLIERIHQCSHLMAVISNYTEKSWWVPFEIGVGTEIDKRITSFQTSSVELPIFLQKWPVLRTKNHLDIFIQKYKEDKAVSISESIGHIKRILTADQFHRELKASL